jgi:hypothetical protein
MNPVEERVRQEAEERIARKVSRGNRTVKRLSTPVAVLTNQSDPPEQKPATNGASPAKLFSEVSRRLSRAANQSRDYQRVSGGSGACRRCAGSSFRNMRARRANP